MLLKYNPFIWRSIKLIHLQIIIVSQIRWNIRNIKLIMDFIFNAQNNSNIYTRLLENWCVYVCHFIQSIIKKQIFHIIRAISTENQNMLFILSWIIIKSLFFIILLLMYPHFTVYRSISISLSNLHVAKRLLDQQNISFSLDVNIFSRHILLWTKVYLNSSHII